MLHDDCRFDNGDMQIEIRKSVSKSVAQNKNVNENRFHLRVHEKPNMKCAKLTIFKKKILHSNKAIVAYFSGLMFAAAKKL